MICHAADLHIGSGAVLIPDLGWVMKIKSKILLMLAIFGVCFILLSNYIFNRVSREYLESQEINQFKTISRTLDLFLNDKMEGYLGTVNNWSHWDEAYAYMNGQNPTFIESSVLDDTFKDLGISIFIIFEEGSGLKTSLFFDFDSMKVTGFPDDFSFDELMGMNENTSDIASFYKVGDSFFIGASSEITDTARKKTGKGRLFIGRQIDDEIIGALENIIGGKVSASLVNTGKDQAAGAILPKKYESGFFLQYAGMSHDKNTMSMAFYIPVVSGDGNMIRFSAQKPRSLFTDGMGHVEKFILVYTLIMLGLVMVTNLMFREYLSKPFDLLMNEVKDIDIAKDKNTRLEIHGRNEFSFLRQSINSLLGRIEKEQDVKEKLQAILNSVGDAVITIDEMGCITFMNPAAEMLTGSLMDEARGHSYETVFNLVNGITEEKLDNPVKKAFKHKGAAEFSSNAILISKDGTEIAIEDTAAPIINESGTIIGIVLVFRDCRAKIEEKKHVEYLSFHDHLTGLYNRRFFEEELKRLDTDRNLPLSIVYADVNGLKTVNDSLGHQSGDLIIQKASEVLSRECRADDIIARTGGDEFIILLPKTSAEGADAIVKRIQQAVEEQQVMGMKLSIAFGSATKDNDTQNVLNILKISEEVMYLEKAHNSSSKRSAVLKKILDALRLKSPREEAHSRRVGLICADIATAYGLTSDKVNELRIAGELHDIGKLAVDEFALNKTGIMTDVETAQFKSHSETGYLILGTTSEYFSIAEHIRSHHEKWDGTGYPKGEKGNDIPWNSRVIALADSYDAMTSGLSQTAACSAADTAAEIKRNAGTQFDPEMARFFVEKILGMDWIPVET